MTRLARTLGIAGAALLALILVAPVLALLADVRIAAITAALATPTVHWAAWTSVWTSTVAVTIVVLCGTPLAWAIARSPTRVRSMARAATDLGVVLPPAVLGIALLLLFGRHGVLTPIWSALQWSPSFTPVAVVLAQLAVAAPLFLQAATSAFEAVDPDLVDVARSLGADSLTTVTHVALPIAAPGIVAGIAVAWARALGEFGATLLFAGNVAGVTQTLPLAIYEALESDRGIATVVAVFLMLLATALFAVVRTAATALGGSR